MPLSAVSVDHLFRGAVERGELERALVDCRCQLAERGDLAARQSGFPEIPVRHRKQRRGIEGPHSCFHPVPNGAGAGDGKLLPDDDPGQTLEALGPFT